MLISVSHIGERTVFGRTHTVGSGTKGQSCDISRQAFCMVRLKCVRLKCEIISSPVATLSQTMFFALMRVPIRFLCAAAAFRIRCNMKSMCLRLRLRSAYLEENLVAVLIDNPHVRLGGNRDVAHGEPKAPIWQKLKPTFTINAVISKQSIDITSALAASDRYEGVVTLNECHLLDDSLKDGVLILCTMKFAYGASHRTVMPTTARALTDVLVFEGN